VRCITAKICPQALALTDSLDPLLNRGQREILQTYLINKGIAK
jgi:hypothetical protein